MRKDIMADPGSLADYVAGCWALKNTPAADPQYSRYDWYVLWHVVTMMTLTPNPNNSGRNAAHNGPAFLPWHRFYLKRLEAEIRLLLGKPDFALPYWNWVADGQLGQTAQRDAAIWQADALGDAAFRSRTGRSGLTPATPMTPTTGRCASKCSPAGCFWCAAGCSARSGSAYPRFACPMAARWR